MRTSPRLSSATQLSPGVFPEAPGATLSDPDDAKDRRSALGLSSDSPVTINFWDFNDACRPVSGWSGFVQAAWDHERQHFEQAEAVLKQPGNNIYIEVEKIVGKTADQVDFRVAQKHFEIQNAAHAAAVDEPTGNWTTALWVWKNLTENNFVLWASPNF